MGHPFQYPIGLTLSRKKSSTPQSEELLFYSKPDGSALVMAAIFMIVAAFLITAGFQLVSNSARDVKQRTLYVAEAENVARAGVVDALAWFGRQSAAGGLVYGATSPAFLPGQPVTVNPQFTSVDDAFDPVGNTTNPTLSDTTDQTIGIVKDYPLDDPVTANATFWGRYEVWKQDAPATTAGFYNPNAVHDITSLRDTAHVTGDGYIWSIVSVGYVYKRMNKTTDAYGNFTVGYNVSPNFVIAKAIEGSEFRKLSLLLPQPTPNNTTAGALFVQNIKSQVTLSSTQTQLSGAVSAFHNYAAVGMTSP